MSRTANGYNSFINVKVITEIWIRVELFCIFSWIKRWPTWVLRLMLFILASIMISFFIQEIDDIAHKTYLKIDVTLWKMRLFICFLFSEETHQYFLWRHSLRICIHDLFLSKTFFFIAVSSKVIYCSSIWLMNHHFKYLYLSLFHRHWKEQVNYARLSSLKKCLILA